jgi:glutathione S-transferase
VPALHVDGQVLWDSLAIGEYLAERFPDAGLWPGDPVLRARARCVSAEMHAGFEALRSALPFNCRALGRHVPLDEAVFRDVERVTSLWRDCFAIKPDASGGLLGGFTIADAMYIPVALRFRTYGVKLDPLCRNYLDWCVSDEHVRCWLEDAALERDVIEHEEVGRSALH